MAYVDGCGFVQQRVIGTVWLAETTMDGKAQAKTRTGDARGIWDSHARQSVESVLGARPPSGDGGYMFVDWLGRDFALLD